MLTVQLSQKNITDFMYNGLLAQHVMKDIQKIHDDTTQHFINKTVENCEPYPRIHKDILEYTRANFSFTVQFVANNNGLIIDVNMEFISPEN